MVTGPSVERSCMRSASFNMETKMEKSLLKTRRSRTEQFSWQTEGGTLEERLGASMGREGNMGWCSGAMKGCREAPADGEGELRSAVGQLVSRSDVTF